MSKYYLSFSFDKGVFIANVIGIVTLVASIFLARYLTANNPLVDVPNQFGHVAGGWSGLWDGICAPFSLIFTGFDTTSEYVFDNHNDGFSYSFWYVYPYEVFLFSIVKKIFKN